MDVFMSLPQDRCVPSVWSPLVLVLFCANNAQYSESFILCQKMNDALRPELVLNLSFFSTCIALKQSIRTSTRTILKGTPASEIRTAVITIRYRRGGRRSNSSPNDSRRLVHFRVCKHDGAYLLNFHIPFLASKRMPTTACS